jgi:putative oxidoreductase
MEQKMDKFDVYTMPVGRVLIALIFIMSGMNKIFDYEATAGWMDSMGVPSSLLPGVIALEVLGGLAIVVGWQTRWVALALAGFTILSAVIFHNDFSNQNEVGNFMKNIAISGGFLFLFATGGGRWSLDNKKPT